MLVRNQRFSSGRILIGAEISRLPPFLVSPARQRAYTETLERTQMPIGKNSNALIGFAVRLFVRERVLLQPACVSIWALLIGQLIYNELRRCAPTLTNTRREQRSCITFLLQRKSASRESAALVMRDSRTIFVLRLPLYLWPDARRRICTCWRPKPHTRNQLS